jgi:hypothetical protein
MPRRCALSLFTALRRQWARLPSAANPHPGHTAFERTSVEPQARESQRSKNGRHISPHFTVTTHVSAVPEYKDL